MVIPAMAALGIIAAAGMAWETIPAATEAAQETIAAMAVTSPQIPKNRC